MDSLTLNAGKYAPTTKKLAELYAGPDRDAGTDKEDA